MPPESKPRGGGSGLSAVDLLLRHGRVITMDRRRRILVDGAVAVRGGLIAMAGPDREVSAAVDAAAVRDLAGALVHPGLVDAHAHAGSSELSRGLAPKDHADYGAIDERLFASASPETDYLGALLSCMELVRNGVTAYADTGGSFFLEEAVRAVEQVGMRGMPGHVVLDANPSVPGRGASPGAMSAEEGEMLAAPTRVCVERLEDQLARYPFRGGGRVRGAVTMYGCMRCSDELLAEAHALAGRTGAPMINTSPGTPKKRRCPKPCTAAAPFSTWTIWGCWTATSPWFT